MAAEQAGKKRRVVVIDSNDAHRQQVAGALRLFYDVLDFGDPKIGLASITHAPPAVIVLDESVAKMGTKSTIAVIRQQVGPNRVPVVLTAVPGDAPERQAKTSGADIFLEKPFRRSVLWRSVSDVISARVERSWATLPVSAATVLRKTVDTFNQVAEGIARGEPVAFASVKDACEPLVAAVGSQDYLTVLEGVRGHDNLAYTHALRVGTLLSAFGHAIGLRGDDLSVLAAGGLLHDVGLLGVPAEIRYKAGALTPEETKTYRSHVPRGVEMLKAKGDVPKGVIAIAALHHERLDGSGYPDALPGEKLNDLVRMASLVDVFVELTDDVPAGRAMPPDDALNAMRGTMQRELDARLVGLFSEMLLNTARAEKG